MEAEQFIRAGSAVCSPESHPLRISAKDGYSLRVLCDQAAQLADAGAAADTAIVIFNAGVVSLQCNKISSQFTALQAFVLQSAALQEG